MRTDKQGATDTGLTNRALVGHNFKNFTVNKPFDCHLLCFVEKCRCQAYQMKGEHSCELLDEERFAAPDDFVEEQGYECYDMSREYEKMVRYSDVINLKIIPVTERGSHVWTGRSQAWRTLTDLLPFQLLFQIQRCCSENNIASGSLSFSYITTQFSLEQTTITMKCIQKMRKKWKR